MKTLPLFLLALCLLAGGSFTLAAPGDVDGLALDFAGPVVFAAVPQPDGKVVIGGRFTSVQGVPRSYIARLNADGSVDMGFDPKANEAVYAIAVQGDGKLLVGGNFTSMQPNGAPSLVPAPFMVRLNGDGTVDGSFDPQPSGRVLAVALQPDGKVLLGGNFGSLQPFGTGSPVTRQRIARMNADGTLDTGFDPKPNSEVESLAVQSDGKVILAGIFTTVQPNGAGAATSRQFIARVNADGTLDTSFDPKPNNSVFAIALQGDGKVLLGGVFSTLQPNGAGSTTARSCLARVNASGTPNGLVYAIAPQVDGKLMVGGDFTNLQPNGASFPVTRWRMARLNADGTLDGAFDKLVDSTVNGLALQQDGKVLMCGSFATLRTSLINTVAFRPLVARMLNDSAPKSLSAASASRVAWTRAGAGPEVSDVSFELSTTGGGAWSSLGSGTRITGGWEKTGLSLPSRGMLRARGRASGGNQNGSSSLIEQVVSFPVQVEQPAGTTLTDAVSTVSFGAAVPGTPTAARTFAVTNTTGTALTVLAVTRGGTNAGDFVLDASGVPSSLAAGASATFTVAFNPLTSGNRVGSVLVAATGLSPAFQVALTGQGLSFSTDTDGDGMSDASELQLAAMGFDWQTTQTALVQSYYANANGAGLYTAAQVQTLNAGTPLLTRDENGVFKLTIGLQKTSNLPTGFAAFPFVPGQTTINGQGQVEFQFTVPDGSAFFRVQAQ